jgi:hypothetical protein
MFCGDGRPSVTAKHPPKRSSVCVFERVQNTIDGVNVAARGFGRMMTQQEISRQLEKTFAQERCLELRNATR